jgi:hypothetical protein
MNMKRGLVFTLCALAAAASASVGRAQTVDLTLNLRYNDPNTPASGGVWYLLGKTTGGTTNLGLAGVSAYITNISTTVAHGSSVTLPAGQNPAAHSYPAVTATTINNLTNGANPFNGIFNGATNVLYGQDISVGAPTPILAGVGSGSGPGNVALDPLKNPSFNNYAVLLSGTFAGGGTAANGFNRPAFSTAAGNVTSANILTSTTPGTPAVAAATVTTHVRGDSLGSLNLNSVACAGLKGGDANRDGVVNGFDFAILSGNFDPPNSTGTKTWDQGNFNSGAQNGRTDGFDFAILSGNFSPPGTPSIPPSFAAVPEPASVALFGIALMGLAIRGKRR